MSTSHPVRRALIVGAGIAGPVTALALARAGIDAVVVDAHPEPGAGIGGSLALAPNGTAALEIVGAADAVRARSLPIERSSMSVADRVVGDTPRLPGQEPLRMIRRGELHAALRAAADAASIEVQYGRRVIAVDESADGVTARFEDGSSMGADVLVGADGVHSLVRRLIDPSAPDAGYTGMLGFEGASAGVAVDREPGDMVFAFGRRAYYLYWPLHDGGVGWGVNLPTERYQSFVEARETSTEDWLRALRTAVRHDTPGRALLERADPDALQAVGGLHIMPPVPTWWRGRMALVGDAVHAPSNSTGQGASLAIESAIELARCLRDLPTPESAFARFEQLRRGRVEAIARRGARINRAKTPGPIGRALMSVLLPRLIRTAGSIRALEDEQRFRIDWDADATG